MGAPDLLAKHLFSEELPSLFGGAISFRSGFDLGFSELRLDGLLTLEHPLDLSSQPAPWCHVRPGFVVVEVKMPGDHTGKPALARALLRRQALEVVALEQKPSVDKPIALWMVAPHLPGWLGEAHRLQPCGPGCHRIEMGSTEVLWVAANELPLDEALMPLLVARSGKKLAELVRWSFGRRPARWVERLLEWGSMTPEQAKELEEELKAYHRIPGPPDEEAARKRAMRLWVAMVPEVGDELRAEGEAKGLREGERALRTAITDLCELLPVELTDSRRAELSALDLTGLEALRAHLKQHRAWPQR